jgi:hypothetical protein
LWPFWCAQILVWGSWVCKLWADLRRSTY